MSEKIAPSENINGSEEKQLESWKEIAAYLKRDVRTVIRWEKSEGLPVHRHLHQSRSSVYAYPSEINAWSATRQQRREEVAAWRRPVPALAFAAVLMLSLLLVADALPPAIFNLDIPMGWTPTLEMTTHVRARPTTEWLRCQFTTRFVTGGLLEEDGEIWDQAGRLVALSRQLALVAR